MLAEMSRRGRAGACCRASPSSPASCSTCPNHRWPCGSGARWTCGRRRCARSRSWGPGPAPPTASGPRPPWPGGWPRTAGRWSRVGRSGSMRLRIGRPWRWAARRSRCSPAASTSPTPGPTTPCCAGSPTRGWWSPSCPRAASRSSIDSWPATGVIAALSRGTVVVEAARRSGAVSTASRALELGRVVMAVPGPVTSMASSGTNRLLHEQCGPCRQRQRRGRPRCCWGRAEASAPVHAGGSARPTGQRHGPGAGSLPDGPVRSSTALPAEVPHRRGRCRSRAGIDPAAVPGAPRPAGDRGTRPTHRGQDGAERGDSWGSMWV